ncbi:MAG: matrixin family metalloprotease [Clostridiaceae bacterium]|jgi:predicted Zn-dependent protease|nr:matrixin family metalloprotease [Clostridiaceae bacterium]
MKKLLLSLLTIFIISIMLMNVVSAVIANLQYWYSDFNGIAHYEDDPKFTVRPCTGSPSSFEDDVLAAYNDWHWAGIPVYYQFNSGDIIVYGGPYDIIKQIYPSFSPNSTGQTEITMFSMNDYYTTPSGNKDGYIMDSAKVYYNTDIANKKTYLHEAGHSLGWLGHSSNSNDIMYPISSSVKKLTSRDKNHLTQVY